MSTYVYVTQRLHPGLLDSLVRGGAEAIEIFCARGHLDYTNRAHVREIASWFWSSGVPLNSMHSPMFCDYEWGRSGAPPINPVDPDRKRRVEAMDEIKRALEVAEQIPFRFMVQHMGIGGEAYDARKFEAGLSSIEHLRAFARPLGVTLLVENIPNELSTPARLLEFLTAGHFDDLGVCFDVGHAHLADGVEAAFEMLKSRIQSTHVHDNARDRDSHLWPGEGSVDWNQAMALLRSAPQAPPLLMEIEGEGKTGIPERMAAAFRKLEEAGK
ncbi:MAG TPA: sugar phosphate isomerase/epimerase [Terriglobales bacterium]|nr:sugar phosphate isomerase/epimerase [Terriglobales bacterium]